MTVKQAVSAVLCSNLVILLCAITAHCVPSLTALLSMLMLIFCVFGCLLLLVVPFLATARSLGEASISSVFFSVLVGGLITITLLCLIYDVILQPYPAWDMMPYWGRIAVELLEKAESDNDALSLIGAERHPLTLNYVLALMANAGPSNLSLGTVYWFYCGIGLGSLTYLWSLRTTMDISFSLLIAYACASIPLVQNHLALGGYAELPMAMSMLAALVALRLGFAENSRIMILLGCCHLAMLVVLKNVGFVYATVIALSFGVDFFAKKIPAGSRWILISLPFLAICSLPQWWFLSDLKVGSRLLELRPFPYSGLSENFLQAVIINSSFGTFIVGAVICILLTLRSGGARDKNFMSLCTTLLLSVILGAQYFDYGYRYATPLNDTGFSRFVVPIAGLAGLLFSDFYARLRTSANAKA